MFVTKSTLVLVLFIVNEPLFLNFRYIKQENERMVYCRKHSHLVRICPYSVPFALNSFLLQQHRPGFPKPLFVIHDLTSFIVL